MSEELSGEELDERRDIRNSVLQHPSRVILIGHKNM